MKLIQSTMLAAAAALIAAHADAGDTAPDCNANGVDDACDIDPADPDGDGIVYADDDADGIPDICQLVGHWKLDECSGVLRDSSASQLDAQRFGTPVTVFGRVETALDFGSGVNWAEVSITPVDTALEFTSTFTLAFWVKGNGPTSGIDTLIDKSHDSDFAGWAIQSKSQAPTSITIPIGVGNSFPEPVVPGVLDDTWHHVGVVVTLEPGLRIRAYVDGANALDQSFPAFTTLAPNGRNLQFGRWFGGDREWDGTLDDVRLYPEPLSPARIGALASMNQPAADCNANTVPDICDRDDTDPDGNGEVSFDCDANGALDECDLDGGAPDADGGGILDACQQRGDLNGDGVVDLSDLAVLLGDFGCVPPGPCPGDVDGDGDVDLGDLAILLGNFGA